MRVSASMKVDIEKNQAAVFSTASQLTTGHLEAVHKLDTAVLNVTALTVFYPSWRNSNYEH